MTTAGSNPMRWDCAASGCFNIRRRPKIESFAECFPGRINFGDVDGLVEVSGAFCLLEWKGDGGSLRLGQQLSFSAFTRFPGNVVFVVDGDAETMRIKRYCIYWMGRCGVWLTGDLRDVKARIKRWAEYVSTRRAHRRLLVVA